MLSSTSVPGWWNGRRGGLMFFEHPERNLRREWSQSRRNLNSIEADGNAELRLAPHIAGRQSVETRRLPPKHPAGAWRRHRPDHKLRIHAQVAKAIVVRKSVGREAVR